MTALLSLLSARQKFFIDKISQPLINESSDFEIVSEDDQLEDTFKDPYYDTAGIVKSKDLINSRLVDIYKIKKARDVILKSELGKAVGHNS